LQTTFKSNNSASYKNKNTALLNM